MLELDDGESTGNKVVAVPRRLANDESEGFCKDSFVRLSLVAVAILSCDDESGFVNKSLAELFVSRNRPIA